MKCLIPQTTRSPHRCKANAFTLIELLVVISIISLLMSILLPALRSARTSAQLISAVSGSQQVMAAMFMYASDHKDSLPWANFHATSTENGGPFWSQKLVDGRYISSPKVLWSPGHVPNGQLGAAAPIYRYTGFAVNHYGGVPSYADRDRNIDDVYNSLDNIPLRIGVLENRDPSIARASDYLIIVDSSSQYWLSSQIDGANGGWTCPGKSDPLFTYNGAVARAYLDGHASGNNSRDLGWVATGMRAGYWMGPADTLSDTDFTKHSHYSMASAPWFQRSHPAINPTR